VASSPDPRCRAIAALLATSAGDRGPVTVTSDPGLQFQAVDAFVDLVESLALERQLVAGVDDLQWADPSSLLTLGALGGRLAGVPVALVGCLRPSPRAAELERALLALDAAGARRLVLGGLDDRAVVELVAEVVAAEPGQRLLARWRGRAATRCSSPSWWARSWRRGDPGRRRPRRGGRDDPAPDPAPHHPAPPELPARRDPGGVAGRLRPGVELPAHRAVHHHRPLRPGAVVGAGRGDPGPGAGGRRRPPRPRTGTRCWSSGPAR
jgi:hypothetical protein